MSNKKIILLIIVVILLSFGNSLWNGFIGDDKAIFFNNNFYRSLSNLSKIFTKEILVEFTDIDAASRLNLSPDEEVSYAVTASFRPIPTISFFVSYFLWKESPWGYHLENILLHIIATILLYFFICSAGINRNIALITSLIFATHPIQTELVNNIGYRSDFFSLIFYLFSFSAYINRNHVRGLRSLGLLFSTYIAFFLALCSKENAISLPFMIVVYDILFEGKNGILLVLKRRWKYYAGFLVVLLSYLYIYLYVFPNVHSQIIFGGQDQLISRFIIICKLFYNYLVAFFLPFTVSVVPPLYVPSVSSVSAYELVLVITVLVGSSWFLLKYARRFKGAAFFIIWFLVTYLPVSNIIPVSDPFSLRFMYMPIIGLCFILALLLEKSIQSLNKRFDLRNSRLFILVAVIGTYVSITFPINGFFKNNLTACHEMIRNYPEASRPYSVLGVTYFSLGEYERAGRYLSQYLQMERRNPFINRMEQEYFFHYLLGQCYKDDHDRAIAEYKMSLALRPDYISPHLDMAWTYMQKKDDRNALIHARKVIDHNKSLSAFIYAIFSCIRLEKLHLAEKLLDEALRLYPQNAYLLNYQRRIEEK